MWRNKAFGDAWTMGFSEEFKVNGDMRPGLIVLYH